MIAKADFVKRLNEVFVEESRSIIETLKSDVNALEEETATDRRMELIKSVHRNFHSLKGAARTVSNLNVQLMSKELEDLANRWLAGYPDDGGESFRLLNQAVAFLEKQIFSGEPVDRKDFDELMDRLNGTY